MRCVQECFELRGSVCELVVFDMALVIAVVVGGMVFGKAESSQLDERDYSLTRSLRWGLPVGI